MGANLNEIDSYMELYAIDLLCGLQFTHIQHAYI